MDEMLVGVLLEGAALNYFEEAIDGEVATMYSYMHDWYPIDLEKLSRIILNRIDFDKLSMEGISFTDKDIDFFKDYDIPEAMKKTLKKFNVTIETKTDNEKLWVRAV